MNILHITPDDLFARKFVHPFAKEQIKKGFNTYIASPTPQSTEKDGVTYINIKTKISKNPHLIFYVFLMIRSILYKKNIDYIFFHTSLDNTILILLTRFFTKKKIIYINHGVAYPGYSGLIRKLLKLIEIININLSHKSYAINNDMANLLNDIKGTNKETIPFIPGSIAGVPISFRNYEELINCRNILKLKSGEKAHTILYVGRLVPRKGIIDLIESSKFIKSNFKILIIGGEAKELKTKFNDEKIIFLGKKDNLEKYYLNSEILCVPSHHEGLGQVYLEAASYGVIPICSDIPGPTSFVKHKITGFSVTPHSPRDIARFIDECISNKIQSDEIRKNAYQLSLNYDQNIICEKNVDLVHKNLP